MERIFGRERERIYVNLFMSTEMRHRERRKKGKRMAKVKDIVLLEALTFRKMERGRHSSPSYFIAREVVGER